MFKKIKGSKVVASLVATSLTVACTAAYAKNHNPAGAHISNDTIDGVRHTILNSSANLMIIIQIIAGIVGLAYLGMGLLSLKAASDSAGQTNTNMTKGFTKIVIGGALIALPFLLNVSRSLTNTGANASSGVQVPGNLYGTVEGGTVK